MNKFRKFATVTLIISIILPSVINYRSLITQTSYSLEKCIKEIIPSLYGSMIIACIVTESNLHRLIGKVFSPVSRFIFKMPSEIFSVFILSNISGYPVGAKLLQTLRTNNNITDKQLKRYCCICFSAGPAFVSGAAVCRIYGSENISMIIFLSTTLANLILAFFCGIKSDIPEKPVYQEKQKPFTQIIVNSVSNASSGMFQMCTMIVAFSVFKVFLTSTGAIEILSGVISKLSNFSENDCFTLILSFFEITNISSLATCDPDIISAMSAIFATGGICVVLQIFSILRSGADICMFLKYRAIASILSFIISRILCGIFLKDIAVTASTIKIYSESNSVLPSYLLIIMTVMLIGFSVKKSDRSL